MRSIHGSYDIVPTNFLGGHLENGHGSEQNIDMGGIAQAHSLYGKNKQNSSVNVRGGEYGKC